MNRRVLKVICTISGVAFLLLTVLLTVMLAAVLGGTVAAGASVGIIGGADGPTFAFLLSNITRSPAFAIWQVALLVFLGSLVLLICTRKKGKD